MRRLAIGLIFLLGACGGKPESEALEVTWNHEANALSSSRHQDWPAEHKLSGINWSPAARGLSAARVQIPEIDEPAPLDPSGLARFEPVSDKALSAGSNRASALSALISDQARPQFNESSQLTKSVPTTIPVELLQ